jgi:hypothetical protein
VSSMPMGTVIAKVDHGLKAAARGNSQVPGVKADLCAEARVSLLVGGWSDARERGESEGIR